MGSALLDFWSLSDPNVVWVLCGAVLLGGSAGLIGTFSVLRSRALVGDVLAHSSLPGVVAAFLLIGRREPEVIVAGGVVGAIVGYAAVEFLIARTKIKPDAAFALVLSTFFALGIFLLTYVQKSGVGGQAGLERLLFGQAASIVRADLVTLGGMAAVLCMTVAALFRNLNAITFDPLWAQAAGLAVRRYELVRGTLLVFAVVIGLQLVGVVLVAAVLIIPAAAARYWSDSLRTVALLAGLFGALSGVAGAQLSYLAPQMPTGPLIVLALAGLCGVSVLCAPRRGLISRLIAHLRLSRRIHDENVLRSLYLVAEQEQDLAVEPVSILAHRSMSVTSLETILARLISKGLVERVGTRYRLSAAGFERAQRLTVLHRLWELYLSERIKIAPDHVHADAELVEHLLTPELEARLREELGFPRTDPHGRIIPHGQEERR